MTTTANRQASPLIDKLAQTSPAYRRQAWLALAGLLAFLILYLALAGWFLYTAYRFTWGGAGGQDAAVGWIVAAFAAFLAVFMLKALFFVKKGQEGHLLELKPDDQPELFRFLHRLADKAGAPRPHKVFVSAEVNAAVFYDLSLLNLFWPSRKNLVMGLGLVEALNLGEFRAVLAHEFGHFAQRAMAVGRWVYVARQIAAHLVARRDGLDDFLKGLSGIDVRLAWIGWLLSLIVWSIRSLVDLAYRGVEVVQRALSREMEMNADLVAVALTGSDALIHALYRLQAADDAWSRAMGYAQAEKQQGRRVPDLFAVQAQVIQQMARLLNDDRHGQVPPLPDAPGSHRLFKPEMAQPPRMWLTHPLNHEREANAKRHYVSAPLDGRPAWVLFEAPQRLREQVTAMALGEAQSNEQIQTLADSLQSVRAQFERLPFHGRYRGLYFRRSPVLHTRHASELWRGLPVPAPDALQHLYPETLLGEMERLRQLEAEEAQLLALQRGHAQTSGGVIQFRDRSAALKDLPRLMVEVRTELRDLRADLRDQDQTRRSLHLAVARALGQGWEDHLKGVLRALHYASHSEANLRDLQGVLGHTVNHATATRKVSDGGRKRVLVSAQALYAAMRRLDQSADQVHLDPGLLKRLNCSTWRECLGELKLPDATAQQLGDWLQAVDSWVDQQANACAALRRHALDAMLETEEALAQHWREGTQPGTAPVASQVPDEVDVLLEGEARPRDLRPNLWTRFQTADGWLAATARLAVAGGIVAAVLGFGGKVGSDTLTVFNGLGRPVMVKVGQQPPIRVGAGQREHVTSPPQAMLHIETHTPEGELIERFDAPFEHQFDHVVYNVASASSLWEWTAVYGPGTPAPERMLGTPRWLRTAASDLFEAPPASIRSRHGTPSSRLVLDAIPSGDPVDIVGTLQDMASAKTLAQRHARWDEPTSPHILGWWSLAAQGPEALALVRERLRAQPHEVLWLRLEQDLAGDAEREAICQRHTALAQSRPQDSGLAYVATRCLPAGPAKEAAFLAGAQQDPKQAWWAYAAGGVHADHGRWAQAQAEWQRARRLYASMGDAVNESLVRLTRLNPGPDAKRSLEELARQSAMVRRHLRLESGQVDEAAGLMRAYVALAQGQLSKAMTLGRSPQGQVDPRLLRLVAASDGADPAWIEQAQALGDGEGLDDETVWAGLILAWRSGRDLQPWMDRLNTSLTRFGTARELVPKAKRYLAALGSGQPASVCESALDGLPLEIRGHALLLGAMVRGRSAPPAWRDMANRLLFVDERPYLR